ncbi:MAG: PorV/PorQ family protein [bacterium]
MRGFSAVCALAVCFGLVATQAQATKLAGEFLASGPGARALGMGGAFSSVADDASAGYWNPAGLVQLDTGQVMLMYSQRFGSLIDHNCFSMSHPLSREGDARSAGAVSLLWLRASDIAMTSNLTEPDVDFDDTDGDGIWDPGTERRFWRPDRVRWESDNELAALLSYARTLRPDLSMGTSAKVIWKDVADITCLGFGVDVGMLYEPTDNVRLGAKIADITTTPLYWDGWYYAPAEAGGTEKKKVSTTETIYPSVRLGASYTLAVAAISGKVLVAADCDFRFEGLTEEEADFAFSDVSGDVKLGALYQYRDAVHVSLGMDQQAPTAGIGLAVGKFGVDYAFWRDEELDNSHRISVNMNF